jgi:hypothetical protein
MKQAEAKSQQFQNQAHETREEEHLLQLALQYPSKVS